MVPLHHACMVWRPAIEGLSARCSQRTPWSSLLLLWSSACPTNGASKPNGGLSMSASLCGGSAVMPYGSRWSSCRSPKSSSNPSSISIRMAMSPGTGRNSKSGAAKILFVVQKIWLVPQISCLCRLAVHVRSHATLYGAQPIHIVPNPLQIFKVLLQSSVPITHPLHREMEVGSSCWPPSISRHWKGRMFSLYTCSSSRSAHQQKMTRSPNITCQPKCWPVHFGSIEGDYHLSFCSTTALGAQRHWARLCLKRPACLDCSEKNVCRNDIES